MKIFLISLAFAIGILALFFWIKVSKSQEKFEVRLAESYWQSVRAFSPLGILGASLWIGVAAYRSVYPLSEYQILTIAIPSFILLIFFPVTLLYFHLIAWLSEKVWPGLGFLIHLSLIGVGTFLTYGRVINNTIEVMLAVIVFILVMMLINWTYRRLKGAPL